MQDRIRQCTTKHRPSRELFRLHIRELICFQRRTAEYVGCSYPGLCAHLELRHLFAERSRCSIDRDLWTTQHGWSCYGWRHENCWTEVFLEQIFFINHHDSYSLIDHSALPHTPKQETKWISRKKQSCQNKMTRTNSLSWKSTASASPKRICAFFLFVKELQFPGSCRGNGLYKFNGQMSNKHRKKEKTGVMIRLIQWVSKSIWSRLISS